MEQLRKFAKYFAPYKGTILLGIGCILVSMGFGLWMDNDWRNKTWDVKDFSKNYFTPEQFGKSLTKALATADEYVWVYTEVPMWWTKNAGAAEKLPPEYMMSVRKAAGK